MHVLNRQPRWLRVPLYNQIAAGLPLAESEQIGTRMIRVPDGYRPGDRLIAVRLNGESLKEAGIYNGDFAIVKLTNRLTRNGELCAVLTLNGLMLKYVWLEPGGTVRLVSRNRRYADIVLPVDDVQVQGVVVRIEKDKF